MDINIQKKIHEIMKLALSEKKTFDVSVWLYGKAKALDVFINKNDKYVKSNENKSIYRTTIFLSEKNLSLNKKRTIEILDDTINRMTEILSMKKIDDAELDQKT